MNKITIVCAAVLVLLVFSCGPKNGDVLGSVETPVLFEAQIEIWKNMMPTVPPSEPNVICNIAVKIDKDAEFTEASMVAGMIKNTEGEDLSSVTLDIEPIFTSGLKDEILSVRAVVDYPERISGGDEVKGWFMFIVDGRKVEIETDPVVVKIVY